MTSILRNLSTKCYEKHHIGPDCIVLVRPEPPYEQRAAR